jgi:circadian clock protein KaiC
MSEPHPAARPTVARVPTGVPGLDALLGGGLLRGGLYLVEGQPGAGKTILGSQCCFAHIAAGGRAAYVTLLTETHARMLSHLRPLAFFTEALLGDALVFLSGAGALDEAGLPGLLDLLRDTIEGRGTTLLVVDGLVTAVESAARSDDLRRLLLGLQAHAEARGCTVLLLARAGSGVDGLMHTMVDGVLALRDERAEAETVRVAEVRKFRGGGYLRGRHAYAITDDGVAFYPRIEAAYRTQADPGGGNLAEGAASSGVAGLDALLGGGLPRGAATLALGTPGTGKTLLGLHFLDAGAHADEPGVYLGFHEPPARILAVADRLGLRLRDAASGGALAFLWQLPASDEPIDALAERLLGTVARLGARRLVLDGLDILVRQARRDDRLLPFWAALAAELRRRGVTTLATLLLPEFFGPSAPAPPDGVAAHFDTLLFLRAVELHSRLDRLVTVLKTSGSAEERTIREFRIDAAGLAVAGTFGGAEATLTGVARPLTPRLEGGDVPTPAGR